MRKRPYMIQPPTPKFREQASLPHLRFGENYGGQATSAFAQDYGGQVVLLSRSTKRMAGGSFTLPAQFAFGHGGDHFNYVGA